MSKTEIFEKLKEVMGIVFGEDSKRLADCTEQTLLVEELGLNSVGILYVMIGIEETFQIRFENVGASEFQTVGDVINYIAEKTAAQ